MQIGGIVLAGGRSRRMGIAKATLPFGAETLLGRVVRTVGEAVTPVVVVAAADQELPTLPECVAVVRDQRPGRGPLEGMAAGMPVLEGADAAYITACDTPLVTPQFIRWVVGLLDVGHDAAMPVVDDLPQPLAGVYRLGLLPAIEQTLAADRLKLLDFVASIRSRYISADELRGVDPDLASLRNLNTPADYEQALAAAGL